MLIVHTSDIHGKLTPQKAKKLLYFNKQSAILLDSGDSISAGNLDVRWRERTLSLMNYAGYTAGTIGNREFHPFFQLLLWKVKDANFPHLSANVVLRCETEKIKPCMILHKEGQRIAIIGLTLPQVRGFWESVLSVRFYDPVFYGANIADQFKECELLIFLTHMGIARDIRLAKELKKPCLILGGHNHIYFDKPLRINDCFIMHSGCYAQYLGLIEVENGKIKGWLEKL